MSEREGLWCAGALVMGVVIGALVLWGLDAREMRNLEVQLAAVRAADEASKARLEWLLEEIQKLPTPLPEGCRTIEGEK